MKRSCNPYAELYDGRYACCICSGAALQNARKELPQTFCRLHRVWDWCEAERQERLPANGAAE